MADQSISCPSCGKKIPLTRALRTEIEASLKQQFDETLQERERALRAQYEGQLEEDLLHAHQDATKKAARGSALAGSMATKPTKADTFISTMALGRSSA